ncbi:MAG: hypothetical protein R6X33_13425 [Candidatus Brocadiia bacterium]
MSTFSWILVVVGVFLVLYAALVLLRGIGKSERRGRHSLGCGFVVLAGVVWGIALAQYMGSWWTGLRLGLGLALVLPALTTLAHPGRGGVVFSVVLLTMAVILAAPLLPRLWDRAWPGRSASRARELEQAARTLRGRIEGTESYIEELRADRRRLRDEIEEKGYTDFADVEKDPEGYALLEELAEVDRLMHEARAWLEDARETLERTRVASRRLERLAGAEEATGVEVSDEEIREVLAEVEATPAEPGPTTVEEHVERERLKELFEEEF